MQSGLTPWADNKLVKLNVDVWTCFKRLYRSSVMEASILETGLFHSSFIGIVQNVLANSADLGLNDLLSLLCENIWSHK